MSEHDKLDYIVQQVEAIFRCLNGRDGMLGLTQKVSIMWRAHVWVLCTLSAAAGCVGTLAIKHYLFP